MTNNVPLHVAIIPDGNRRFAKRLMKRPWKGHEWGIEKIKSVFEWSKEIGVRYLTFYALSIENFEKRPKRELDFIFNLARKEIKAILGNSKSFVHKDKVKMNFFGKLELLPKDLQENIKELMHETKLYNKYVINIALVYGGRQEIVDTCRKIGLKIKKGLLDPEKISETVVKHNLYTNGLPDPDLIIRTSERRLSGFLLWQAAYSELAFIDTYWPELTKRQYRKAILDYSSRERRLGR